MKTNLKIIIFAIIGVVIGLVIGWLIFDGINTTGNAVKGINNEITSTIGTIMAKGVKEGSKDSIYVNDLLINNGYSTTDGRTYINKALETTTVLCYKQDNEDRAVGGNCCGSCTGTGGDNCIVEGCMIENNICQCITNHCDTTSSFCYGDCDGGAAID